MTISQKKQPNIRELLSLSGDKTHIAEQVGNAEFQKAIDSLDKSLFLLSVWIIISCWPFEPPAFLGEKGN